MPARDCKYCSKPLGEKKRTQAKFCNDSCRAAFHRSAVDRVNPSCLYCGKEIPSHRRSHAKYCSDYCKRKAWKEKQ